MGCNTSVLDNEGMTRTGLGQGVSYI